MVVDSLPDDVRGLVVGSVAASEDLAIPERHLGIVTVQELGASAAARAQARERAGSDLDLDRIVEIAAAPERGEPQIISMPSPPRRERLRMAIAQDEAFHFYYEENLDLLRRAGFELVPFRPTADPALPSDVDIVYLGGGYPESFAAELAANESLAADLRERATHGLPIFAECGGFIYLGRSLTGFDGETHAMAGVLPLDFTMDREHLSIAYVTATTASDSPLGPAGTIARGQEFHQSRIVASPTDPRRTRPLRPDPQRRPPLPRRPRPSQRRRLLRPPSPRLQPHRRHQPRPRRQRTLSAVYLGILVPWRKSWSPFPTSFSTRSTPRHGVAARPAARSCASSPTSRCAADAKAERRR